MNVKHDDDDDDDDDNDNDITLLMNSTCSTRQERIRL